MSCSLLGSRTIKSYLVGVSSEICAYVLHVLQVTILIYGFMSIYLGQWFYQPSIIVCSEDITDCLLQWLFVFILVYEGIILFEIMWSLTAYSHCFDIEPETLKYDFGLAEPAKYKRKKKHRKNNNYIYISHMDHERVITNEEIKLNNLPSWLMNLTHGKLRDLINNLHMYSKDYDGATPEETFRMVDIRTALTSFQIWYHTPDWKVSLINLLRVVFEGECTTWVPKAQKVIPYHTYILNPVIYAPGLYDLGEVETGSFWYEFVRSKRLTSYQLTPGRIREIIKSNINRLSDDEIITLFTRKMTLDMSMKESAWVIPYIPYEYLTVQNVEDTSHRVLSSIRERVLMFVRNYLKVARLPSYERSNLKKIASAKFAIVLGKPKYQKMFIEGVPRDFIMDTVYMDHYSDIYECEGVLKIHELYKKTTTKKSQMLRQKARDDKLYFQSDIQVEVGIIGTFIQIVFNWLWEKIMWQVFGIQYYRAKKYSENMGIVLNTFAISTYRITPRILGDNTMEMFPAHVVQFITWHAQHMLEPRKKLRRELNFFYECWLKEKQSLTTWRSEYYEQRVVEAALLLWHHNTAEREYWDYFEPKPNWDVSDWINHIRAATLDETFNYIPMPPEAHPYMQDKIYKKWREELTYHFECKMSSLAHAKMHRVMQNLLKVVQIPGYYNKKLIMRQYTNVSMHRIRTIFYTMMDFYPLENEDNCKYQNIYTAFIAREIEANVVEMGIAARALNLNPILQDVDIGGLKSFIEIPQGTIQQTARMFNAARFIGVLKLEKLQWEYYPHEMYNNQFAVKCTLVKDNIKQIDTDEVPRATDAMQFNYDSDVEEIEEPTKRFKSICQPGDLISDIESEMIRIPLVNNPEVKTEAKVTIDAAVTTEVPWQYYYELLQQYKQIIRHMIMLMWSIVMWFMDWLPPVLIIILFMVYLCYEYNIYYTWKLREFSVYMYLHAYKFYYGQRSRPVRIVIDTWTNCFFHDNMDLAPEAKLVLVNIKALLHAAYYAVKGDWTTALSHATYCAVTEPKLLIEGISSIRQTVDPFTKYDITPETYTNSLFEVVGGVLRKFDIVNMSDAEIRRANSQFQFMNNSVRAFNGAMGMTNRIVAAVSRTVYGFDPFDLAYRTYVSELIDSRKAMDRLLIEKNRDLFTKIVIDNIRVEYFAALSIVRDPRFDRELPGFTARQYMERFKEFEKLYKQANNYLDANIGRFETVAVLFCGPNSVGKSASLKLIKQMIVRAEWLEADDKTRVPAEFDPTQEFIFNDATEYFEGYHQQKIVICDDFGSSADVADRRMGALPHIHMVNGEKYNLNMAFEGKGGTNFDSDYLFITTNLFNDGFDNTNLQLGLTDNEAWKRRMNLVVYRVKRLEDESLEDATWLVERSLARPDLIGKVITTREVALLTIETKKYKMNRQDNYTIPTTKIDEFLQDREIRPRLPQPGEFDHAREMRRRERLLRLTKLRNQGLEAIAEEKAPDNNNNIDIIAEVDSDLEDDVDGAADGATVSGEGTIFQHFVDEDRYSTPPKRKGFRTYSCEEILTYFAENNMYEWCNHKHRDIIIGVAVLVCLIIIGKMAYDWFSLPKEEYDVVDEAYSTHMQGKAPKRTVKIRYAKDIRPQNMDLDKHNTTLKVGDSVARLKLRVYDREGNNLVAGASECFHVRDDYYLCCYHTFAQVEDYMAKDEYEIRLELETKYGVVRELFNHQNLLAIQDKDMCLYYLRTYDLKPVKYSRPPGCFKNIVNEREMPGFVNGAPMSLVTREGQHCSYVPVNYLDLRANTDREIECHQAYGYTYCVRNPLRYTSNTRGGYSGAPVTYHDKNGAAIIVGIHYGRSGAREMSFATPITKEFIQSLIEQFDGPIVPENDPTLEIAYIVPSDKGYLYPTNSKIKKGPMWGCFGPPKYVPAKLKPYTNRDGEFIEPYIKASAKLYQTPTPFHQLPEDLLLSYLQYCFPNNFGARLLTFDECLAGVPSTEMKSICLGTSAGYPWNLGAGKGKYKYVWIDENDQYQFEPKFLQYLLECDAMLQAGEQVEVIWCDILKDERVSHKKIKEGKTRLFAGCPLHYLFLMRRYTLAFVEYMQSLCVTGPVSIGINAHSDQWAQLAMRFENCASVVSGDYKNFDGSIPHWVGKIIVRFINAWYNDGPINARVRELLFEHIWFAWRIHGCKVYRVARGNPSGNPFTGPYNSLANIIMLVFCAMKLGIDPVKLVIAAYGDDNLLGFPVQIMVKHLIPIIAQYFGMTYTDWTKEEISDRIDSIWTVRYLGREFKRSGSYVLAPLELDTILESIYWYKKGNTPEEALIQVAENFFTELAHHGKSIYDMYSNDLLRHVSFREPNLYDMIAKVRKPWFHYINRFYHPDDEFEYPKLETTPDIEPEGLVLFEDSNPVDTKDSNEFNERSTNVPVPTQIVPLGHYADVNESEASNAMSAVNHIYDLENFEHMNLNSVLEREYMVFDGNWSTSNGVNHVLASVDFPGELFMNNYLSKKLADFRFFKGGVEVTVRITASKFLYGTLVGALVPLAHAMEMENDVGYLSGFPHILLNADAATTGSISQDFISPYREIKLQDWVANELATFKLLVLNPLHSIDGEVHSCRVQVYAKFTNAKVSMPSTYLVVAENSDIIPESMNEPLDKAYANVVDTTLDSGKAIVAGAGKLAKNIPDFIKTAAAGVEVMAALNMPTAFSQTTIGKIHPAPDLNQGRGVKMLPKAALDPNNQVAPRLDLGMAQDEMNIAHVMGTPNMVAIHTLTPSSTSPILLDSTSHKGRCYADWFSQMFGYVAGSTKYKIYVGASKYHNVRVVFWINFESTTHATSDWQDCYHQIYEIEGSTEIEFTVPFLSRKIFRTAVEDHDYYIRFAVISWSQSDMALNLPIYFNVYKAMDKDVDVAMYLDTSIEAESNPRADFCNDFRPFHSSFKPWNTDKIVHGEKITSVRELIHKWYPYQHTAGDEYVPAYQQSSKPGTRYIGIEKLGRFYGYHRGSIQFRCVQKNAAYECITVTMGNNDNFVLAAADICTPYVNPFIELELPFYYDKFFKFNNAAKHNMLEELHIRTSATTLIWKAAADDFSFGLLRPLPTNASIVKTNSTHGYRNLHNWYST